MPRFNKHHILHYAEYWSANRHNKRLRESLGMLALIDVEVHDSLHPACAAPPPLDPFTAERVHRLYVPHPNPIQAIDNLRFAIDKSIRHPKTHSIEKEIGLLTIEAVTTQLPYIREGIVSDI